MSQRLFTNLKPEQPRRRRLRLPEFDYGQAGAYFVTICTRGHACLFGRVLDGEMQRNAAGDAAVRCWDEIPRHFPHVELDASVVMPNHIHGVLLFGEAEDTGQPGPAGEPARAGNPPRAGHARPLKGLGPVWQRSYWERVVRTPEESDQIRDYIEDNPLRWPVDAEFSHQ
jgi:REP element-mobilizing transposase RayT